MFNNKVKKRSESGNALFLILIAVALFAALSYAVTQSGRGQGTVTRETALIAAAQLTQYPAALRTSVTRMVITGTDANAVAFTAASGSSSEVFDPSGGGAVFQQLPNNIGSGACGNGQAMAGACTTGSWGFKSLKEDPNKGFYILDVGSNVKPAGREIFAYVHNLDQTVCEQVNKGLTGATTINATGGAVDLTQDSGLGLNADGAALATHTYDAVPGGAFSCVQIVATGVFDYYHALMEN